MGLWIGLNWTWLNQLWKFWNWRRTVSLIAIVFTVLYLGGLMFQSIENAYLSRTYAGTETTEREVLVKYAEILTFRQVVTTSDLKEFYHEFNEKRNKVSSGRFWSASDGVYFCMTLITTIGYGDITPQSPSGKVLTIVFGVFGISLFSLLLADCIALQQKIYLVVLMKLPMWHGKPWSSEKQGYLLNIGLLLTGVTIIYLVFIITPALILHFHMDWNILDAQYFLFVTFSTTGFGDFSVRGVNDFIGVVYLIYLIFGLSALVGFLSSMTEVFALTSQKLKMQLIPSSEEDDEKAPEGKQDDLSEQTGGSTD